MLALAAVATIASPKAWGHGVPIDLKVVNGALRVSHGGPSIAPRVISQTDEEGDPAGPFSHPVLGITLLWGVPGIDIVGMAPSASLALELLAPQGIAEAPRALWYWDAATREVIPAPTGAELRLLPASGPLVAIRAGDTVAPSPTTLATTVAGQTGYHNHGLLNFASPYDGTAPAGVFGFFGRFTSNEYAPSEWFLTTFNRNTGYDELAPAGEAIWLAAFPGDYDRNGAIDAADLAAWSASYGAQTTIPRTLADGNGDSVIDAADYTVWRDNLGSAATAVPEPATAALLAMAVAAARVREQRGVALGSGGRTGRS
jgi:hypothetical protein